MAHSVVMPQAGQSMTEGKIVEWLVNEGDAVRRGDPLLTIETDKANMDVEAPAKGVVRKIFRGVDEVVPILEVIAVIGEAGEEIDLEALRSSGSGPAAAAGEASAAARSVENTAPPGLAFSASAAPARPTPAAATVGAGNGGDGRVAAGGGVGRVRSSPLARRMARIRGVDICELRGTGPQGRIIRRDVEAAGNVKAPVAASPHMPGGAPGVTVLPPYAARPYPPPSPRPPSRVAVEGMRRAIASTLQRSKVQAPHFYLSMDIDMTAAVELRRELEVTGSSVSVNDLIVRAAAIALVDEPRVNCRVSDDAIEYPAEVNIGIAVGLDDGLVVPVVTGVEGRDLAGIAAQTRRIIAAAKDGKLIGSGQGTFTISNLGMFGVDSFTAVINPPEGAILAVGAATPRFVPMAEGFFQRAILKATLSADHRAIDGLLAAKFMSRLRHLLESPARL